ncbi:SCO2584 family spore wall biosynthesis protein [Streptomyces solicavernae]
MPEDVGGTPSADGREPDDDRDHGRADEEFAAVVFDEDFVRSAAIHEPSAVERLLAQAQDRAEAEHRRRGHPEDRADDRYDDRYDLDAYDDDHDDHDGHDGYADRNPEWGDAYGPYGPDGPLDLDSAGRRTPGRWHRPVAWVLALVMGIGMVALAFTAVYRGNSGHREDPVPAPTTTGVDSSPSTPVGPSVPVGPSTPVGPSVPVGRSAPGL